MQKKHQILRQTIELEVQGTEGADYHALSQTVGQWGNHQFPAWMQPILDGLDDPDLVIQIPRMEVELECSADTPWEQSLEQQFPELFRAALLRAIQADHSRQHVPERDVDIWLFFLQNGYLPWSADTAVFTAEWEQRVLAAFSKNAFLTKRLTAVLAQKTAIQRLMRQFSPQFRLKMAQIWQPQLAAFLQEQPRFWENPGDERAFWQTLIQYPNLQTIAALQEKMAQRAETPAEQKQNPPKPLDETGVFVENAGLVLLHPFLAMLFKHLELTHDNTILDPDKALFLLHFAATGTTEAQEWELVVPKVLCGLPLDYAAPTRVELTSAAKTEVEELLKSVVEHWGALGNTTPDGLRDGFLRRKGRLSDSGDTYILKVEQLGYDMLLEQLPWGIGMIKLPWNQRLLRTEWV